MSDLIVGSAILNCKLIKNGDTKNLKHSTYDLTIGEIFPIGGNTKENRRQTEKGIYFLQPRETVLVLSREQFSLPGTVTGLATLRTTLTKQGLLALNVGIIDPYFNGPISTTLINFSERVVPIKIGDCFFRVLFMLHKNTERGKSEDMERAKYIDQLTIAAYRDFPRSFLNIPDLDNKFYAETAWRMLKGATIRYWYFSIPFWLFNISVLNYLIGNERYWKFTTDQLRWFKDIIPFF